MSFVKYISFSLILILSTSKLTFGHEEDAHFSGAFLEPIFLQHAHLEDEQSLDTILRKNFQKETGCEEEDAKNCTKRSVFDTSLKIAKVWDDEFLWGSELLIDLSDQGNDDNRYALGDIEIFPVKYAFINEPETIVTGGLSIGLPTGDKYMRLGRGR